MTGRAPVVLVDMDGPLADLEAAVAAQVEDNLWASWEAIYIPTGSRVGFAIDADYETRFGGRARDLIRDITATPGFYRWLPIVDGAVDALNAMLVAGLDVRICSAPMRFNATCASDKIDWVARHLGPDWADRLILTRDKSICVGDLLIDDKPDVTRTVAPTWTQVVWDAPYNQQTAGPRLTRWDQWGQVIPAALQLAGDPV